MSTEHAGKHCGTGDARCWLVGRRHCCAPTRPAGLGAPCAMLKRSWGAQEAEEAQRGKRRREWEEEEQQQPPQQAEEEALGDASQPEPGAHSAVQQEQRRPEEEAEPGALGATEAQRYGVAAGEVDAAGGDAAVEADEAGADAAGEADEASGAEAGEAGEAGGAGAGEIGEPGELRACRICKHGALAFKQWLPPPPLPPPPPPPPLRGTVRCGGGKATQSKAKQRNAGALLAFRENGHDDACGD